MPELHLLEATVDLASEPARLITVDHIKRQPSDTHLTEVVLTSSRVPDERCDAQAEVEGVWRHVAYRATNHDSHVGQIADGGQAGLIVSVPPAARLLRVVCRLKPAPEFAEVKPLEPTAVRVIAELAGTWPYRIRVELEPRTTCKALGFRAAASLDHHVDEIDEIITNLARVGLHQSGDQIMSGLRERFLKRPLAKLQEALDRLVSTVETMATEPAVVFDDGYDGPAIRAATVEVHALIGQTAYSDGTIADLVEQLRRLRGVLAGFPELRWRFAGTDVRLPRSELLALTRVLVPVSPAPGPANRTGGRIGSPAALCLLGLSLAALAWRLNGGPWAWDTPCEPEAAAIIDRSREAIVAYLLVFPALLVTQLDRTYPSRLPHRVNLARITAALNLCIVIPTFISVAAIGPPRHTLLTWALLLGTVFLVLAALAIAAFTSDWAITRSHQRIASKAG